ncbi:DMT family transporter [Candidatus Roizmanbacteria bacterium]|nr:DMT family transporter [Candidatus Roizmanbacteria bacterium]
MGLIFILIAEFLWALELILIRKFFPTQNSFVVSAVTCLFAAFFYMPVFLLQRVKFTLQDWIVLAILGFTSWFLGQLFYVTGIQRSESAVLSTLAVLFLPLCALVMGAVFLKEPLTQKAIIGGVFMIAGFLIISL